MANYKLISFDKIPSTQTYAHELISSGHAIGNTIIMANSQTAGRGRYRRTWVSNPGNLYVSFIFNTETRNPRLSYSVAVAICETLRSFGIGAKIKWPNDILIDNKKVCGVLIEYAKDFVIIGIGINIKSNPNTQKYETTKLNNYINIDKNQLLSAIMKSLDLWLPRDFFVVREKWMEWAISLNKTILYRGKEAELIGINEDGALVLRDGSEYIITYGDEISI